jgi:hypothetical protein
MRKILCLLSAFRFHLNRQERNKKVPKTLKKSEEGFPMAGLWSRQANRLSIGSVNKNRRVLTWGGFLINMQKWVPPIEEELNNKNEQRLSYLQRRIISFLANS